MVEPTHLSFARALSCLGLCLLVCASVSGCASPFARIPSVPDGVERELVFAVLSDLHIGEGHEAYDGQEDTVTGRLRATVAYVNSLALTQNVSMVFITGDLTDSAERSEFAKARELLDGLSIPYYPVLGNHDVWPYTRSTEAGRPRGDRFFHEAFGQRFEGLPYAGGERVRDPRDGEYKQLQNFLVEANGFAFFGLDFNTRRAALLTYKGAHPEADTHDYPGGTLPWLRERLTELPPDTKRVFFFQHHPFRIFWPVPDWFFGFDSDEKEGFRDALLAAHPPERYGAVFAGHLHRRAQTLAFDELPGFPQVETGACKETLDVTLVETFDDGSYRIRRATAPSE